MTELLPTFASFNCFACGPENPKGLHLRFQGDGPDRIRSELTLGKDYAGLGRVVHGGLVATVFDEAMAWCLYRYRYAPYLTATMDLRFRGAIDVGTPLVVMAWIEDDRGSRLRVEASLATVDRAEVPVAEARGLYVQAPAAVLEEVPAEQRAELEKAFELFRHRDATDEARPPP